MKKLLLFPILTGIAFVTLFSSCKKDMPAGSSVVQNEETALRVEADQSAARYNTQINKFQQEYNIAEDNNRVSRNLTELAISLPYFKSLVAAVVKTDLAGVLADANLNATVFAPTDAAFSKLPAPFNNASNISSISDPAQIAALKNILLYHVLGSRVLRNQITPGRSNATTLKPVVAANDNVIYISNSLGILLINGKSLVLLANVPATNGVIHVIDDVLIPPSQNIAQIAIGNPAFSTLVAALVKTNLAGVFTGTGNFTVFAPTNAAFAQLPAPFNNAANISNINDPAQITALANILKYHVTGSRYFAWDLGIFRSISTLANQPNNTLTGVLGFDGGYVKGISNPSFSRIHPANILALNGVVQVIDRVLLP